MSDRQTDRDRETERGSESDGSTERDYIQTYVMRCMETLSHDNLLASTFQEWR